MLEQILDLQASKYGCPQTNCTKELLARQQWGAANITRDSIFKLPLIENDYIDITLTVANWGNYPTPGVSAMPEWYAYTALYNSLGY